MMAGAKYQLIGENYELEHLTRHPEKRATAFVEIFSRLGIRTKLESM
jgi:hypothetical protein